MKNKEKKKNDGTPLGVEAPVAAPAIPQTRPRKTHSKFRVTHRVLDIWEREKAFIENIFNLLPKKYEDADEHLEDYLIDLSDSEETKKREKFERKTKKALEASGVLDVKEEIKEENGDASTNGHHAPSEESPKKKKKGSTIDVKPSREELLERLHAKIALVAQKKKDPEKSKAKKEKKIARKNERRKDSKKQFTSKTNPNLKGSKSANAVQSTPSVKTEHSASETEKTPLRKSVKKSDGQVVYSKFDFIHEDKHVKSKKQKPAELLKNAEKAEGKIARLEAIGKMGEAVHVAESQKWLTAIKRAQGDKVKDDPELLKKTIKKEKKLKEVSKKKWKERIDNVEKQKDLRVKQRVTNIQARKDDKKKKQKKIQRKRGRIL